MFQINAFYIIPQREHLRLLLAITLVCTISHLFILIIFMRCTYTIHAALLDLALFCTATVGAFQPLGHVQSKSNVFREMLQSTPKLGKLPNNRLLSL